MNPTDFYQQYGVSESSLSPSVREGINKVLQSATLEGFAQLGKIMQEEAAKRGIVLGGVKVDAAQEQAAVLAAKEEYERQQAAAKRNRIILISAGAVALLVGIVVGVYYLSKRKRKP